MQKHTLALLLAVMAGGALTGCGEQAGPTQGQMPPTAVDVVTLGASTVTLDTELTGRTSALRIAEVRPQVSGILKKRLFTEGSDVKAGDLLYQIDPSLYEAEVASARANVAKAQANERTAQLKAKRYESLLKVKSISSQDYDDALAGWKQAQAEVMAAKAAQRTAEINLGYTRITAPISGRISSSAVTEGALVTAQQATALTTIQQLDPMYVDVRQSTADLLRLKQLAAAGKLKTDERDGAPVNFTLEDGNVYPEAGSLQFSDVSVDETTGMVTLRVVVPNPHNLLMPGMFMRATLQEGQRQDALLVPQVAVSRTPRGGASVMVVTADNKVEAREVQVSRMVGSNWLVESGLEAGEKVIVAGLQKVKPGAEVNPSEAKAAVTPAAPQSK